MMTGSPVARVRAHAMELHRGQANELQAFLVSFLALLQKSLYIEFDILT